MKKELYFGTVDIVLAGKPIDDITFAPNFMARTVNESSGLVTRYWGTFTPRMEFIGQVDRDVAVAILERETHDMVSEMHRSSDTDLDHGLMIAFDRSFSNIFDSVLALNFDVNPRATIYYDGKAEVMGGTIVCQNFVFSFSKAEGPEGSFGEQIRLHAGDKQYDANFQWHRPQQFNADNVSRYWTHSAIKAALDQVSSTEIFRRSIGAAGWSYSAH